MLNLPLAGKRILITRAAAQQSITAALVKQYGATGIAFPCLQLETLQQNIEHGLRHISDYSDILFTSVNGIEAVLAHAPTSIYDSLQQKRLAVVGQKTAQTLKKHGLNADIVAASASQEGLIQVYQAHGLPLSLLFFRAEHGSDALQYFLAKHDVTVRLIKAYRNSCPCADNSDVLKLLSEHAIDAVLLGSAKTAEHYLQRLNHLELANRPLIVCISQNVADAADKLGLKVQLIAKQANFPSMLDSLAEYFSSRSL